MAELLQFSRPLPADDTFIRTAVADDILRSIDLVRHIEGPAMTMVSGAPGVGKTGTLDHYARITGDASIMMTVAQGEGNPSHLASALMGYTPRGVGTDELRQPVMGCIGRGRVLLVDEAQHLYQRHRGTCTKGAGFEWLRAASAEGGFDVAFCGDLTLHRIIDGFGQLSSRMRRPVIIPGVEPADVLAKEHAEGIAGANANKLLTAAARLKGGLRNVENVARMAKLFAADGTVTAGHIRAALIDLKLVPKGETDHANGS